MGASRTLTSRERAFYRASTGLVLAVMLFSIINFVFNDHFPFPNGPEGAFVHLGFPPYFKVELTIAKILGVLALVIPAVPFKVKEFAYAGFAITLVSAAIAHFGRGDARNLSVMYVIDPLVFFCLLAVSYYYFEKSHSLQAGARARAHADHRPALETVVALWLTITLADDGDSGGGLRIALTTFNEHRSLLFSIAYRMLGTVADAEDMLQDAFIRWQQAPRDEIRSPKAFLVTIVSRLCINHLQSARAQREEYVGQWLPEPVVTDAASDPTSAMWAGESISMAFLVLLERLNPIERAVFLLREVFDYDYAEISAAVGRTEANCRQILRRAKEHVHAARPRFTPSARKQTDLLARFVQAATNGDLDGLVALLASDAELHTDGGGKAPALPNLVHGATNIARAILGGMAKFAPKTFVTRLVEINGEPGFVSYFNGKPAIALVLHISDDNVQKIFAISNPAKLARLPGAPS